jgi:hypothetical protein
LSLAVQAAIIAGGIYLGRVIARLVHKHKTSPKNAPPSLPDHRIEEVSDPFDGFQCKLGDVVVRRFEGDEAWLAGALVLAEDRPVAALFVAPDAQGERAVFVRGRSESTLVWLTPLGSDQIVLSGEPPPALEHGGTRFHRTRRLPVRVERVGTGAPDVGGRAIVGEYAALGLERIVVIVGSDASLAWRGVSLSEAQYDVLPGGQATLQA